MLTAVRGPLEEVGVVVLLPALNVRLHMKMSRAEVPSVQHSPVVSSVATPRGQAVQSVPARSPLPFQKGVAVPTEPEPRTPPSFDLDDLRAQSRGLAHSPPASLVRGLGAHRNLAPVSVQDLLDRPILDALSRRMGRTLVVTSEQRMSDGGWMIRFADNTCLRVPQHLPEWQRNPMGATVLVPMTCGS